MAKIRPNKEILTEYENYSRFLDTDKMVCEFVRVSKPKGNHGTSLYSVYPLLYSDVSFGNATMTCEVRNGDSKDCSFQILTDAIKTRVAMRYDTGGGTHRNDVPHIPLEEQSVTTPHFHKYDSNGYFLAYKTELLNDPKKSEYLFDIDFAFPYFCQEGKIFVNERHDLPEISVGEDGVLPFKEDDEFDPLEGINF